MAYQPTLNPQPVSATDLDVRNLSSAQDSVEAKQTTHDNLNLNANVQQGNADVGAGNPLQVSLANSTNTLEVVGDAAHDSPVVGNPLLQGGEARTTNPTAVADGDVVRSMHDDLGRRVVVLNQVRDLVTHANDAVANTTEKTILAAGAAGVFHDLTAVTVANTSTTTTRVDFRDDTAGTIRFSLWVPAKDTRGIVFTVPLPQAVAAKPWTAQSSATANDLKIFMQAVKNV